MKTKTIRTLQILSGVYAVLYLAAVVSSFFDEQFSFSNPINDLFIFLFLLFMAGFAYCWKNEKIAGFIFFIWNAGVWIYDLWLARGRDSGMFCIMAVPVLVIGALFLLQWYNKSRTSQPSVQKQWKFILQILLINYTVLYSIVVLSEIFAGEAVDYFTLPVILFSLMLPVFLLGFALSWKKEFPAGFIFLFWYAILIYGNIAYSEMRDSGPWIIFGIPVLLQGLFYIKNHYSFKSVNKPA
jgi:hypothetical protein